MKRSISIWQLTEGRRRSLEQSEDQRQTTLPQAQQDRARSKNSKLLENRRKTSGEFPSGNATASYDAYLLFVIMNGVTKKASSAESVGKKHHCGKINICDDERIW
jgi:hypothetical protein